MRDIKAKNNTDYISKMSDEEKTKFIKQLIRENVRLSTENEKLRQLERIITVERSIHDNAWNMAVKEVLG